MVLYLQKMLKKIWTTVRFYFIYFFKYNNLIISKWLKILIRNQVNLKLPAANFSKLFINKILTE